MKCLKTLAAGTVLMTLTFAGFAQQSAGFVDFGRLAPPKDGEFVEVNIGKTIISIAARILQKTEAEAAEVLRGIERVRVNVVGMDDDNREDIRKRIESIREQLSKDGWETLVTVKEKKEDVAVYLKTRGEEAVEGLVITVIDGARNAVFVNIVGNIQPDKIGLLGEKLDIKPLKKASAKLKSR